MMKMIRNDRNSSVDDYDNDDEHGDCDDNGDDRTNLYYFPCRGNNGIDEMTTTTMMLTTAIMEDIMLIKRMIILPMIGLCS